MGIAALPKQYVNCIMKWGWNEEILKYLYLAIRWFPFPEMEQGGHISLWSTDITSPHVGGKEHNVTHARK